MKTRKFLISFGKMLLCSLAFILGAILGGMIVSLLGLQPPPMPEGVDGNLAFLILMLESPLLALSLFLIARGLGGGLLSRALTLSLFTWVVYTLNTTIESLAFTSTTVEGALFTTLSFLLPSIFCGTTTAWLFPPGEKENTFAASIRSLFNSRSFSAWIWRITLASVIFVPIYLAIGSLVAPLTAQYFQESMFGLVQPSQEKMLLILIVRSFLFLLASLPIIILWRRSKLSLFLSLGFAFFILVGLLYMLSAYYMPLEVRLPHTLEILVDSFAYAGFLVILLAKHDTQNLDNWKQMQLKSLGLIE